MVLEKSSWFLILSFHLESDLSFAMQKKLLFNFNQSNLLIVSVLRNESYYLFTSQFQNGK